MLEDACMGYIGLRGTCFKPWIMRFDELLCGLGLGSVLAEFLMILSCFWETNYGFEFLRLIGTNVGD